MTLNEKSRLKNSNRVCKRVKIFIRLKKTCLGVSDRGDRDKDNKTSLKEGRVIQILTTVLHSRAAPLLYIYLPVRKHKIKSTAKMT